MKQNKTPLLIVGALFVAFSLGAAAFAFLPSLFTSEPAQASGGMERIIEIAIEDEICDENDVCETHGGSVQIGFEEADGLPELDPDMAGLYVSHTDDTLTLGTGNINVEVSMEQINDQEPVEAVSAVHSGPDVELRISDSTQIYLDTTPKPEPSPDDFAAGTMVVKSIVEPSDLSSLARNTMVRAWGIMDGDVLNADVIVIEPIR